MKFKIILLITTLVVSVLIYVLYLNMDKYLIDKTALVLGHELPTLSSCMENIDNESQDNDLYYSTDICYHQIHSQGLLNDFQIRRAQYSLQYYSSKIILWMVVIITLSGVILSALQLAATYQLAKAGQSRNMDNDNHLSVEEGKVIFKSSITGLFILLFSFAFFYVYIWKVYTIYEINPDGNQSIQEDEAASLPITMKSGTLILNSNNDSQSAHDAVNALEDQKINP